MVLILRMFLFLLPLVSAQNTVKRLKDYDTYSEEELDLLPKFRKRVEDALTLHYMSESKYLVRFLRAKGNDLNEAEKLIRQNMLWRKDYKVDNMIFRNFSSLVKRMPFHFTRDHDNRPGIVASLKNVNARDIIVRGEYAKMKNYVISGIERAVWNIHLVANETGRELIEGYLLFNMAGFNVRAHACLACMPLWVEIAESYEKYYPRLAYKIIAINVPKIFISLLRTVKPYITADTIQRGQLYSVDKGEWQPELLKLFPKENLEVSFGGTVTNPKLYELTPAHLKIMLG